MLECCDSAEKKINAAPENRSDMTRQNLIGCESVNLSGILSQYIYECVEGNGCLKIILVQLIQCSLSNFPIDEWNQ